MVRKSRLLLLALLLSTIGLAWPAEVAAQRAVPRGGRPSGGAPTTGTAVARPYPARYNYPYRYSRYYYPYVYPRYYYPYAYPFYAPFYGAYYPGFSFGFGFGYGWPAAYWGSYGYPYAYPYGYGSYPYYWDNTGSARLMITPRNAQVYVDGRFVGLVDNFDGSLQRLHVETGEHDVQIYLEGYRTLTQKVLFTRGTTLKIESALQPLAPGETPEPRPVPTRSAAPRDSYERQSPPPYPSTTAGFGTLSLRVNPADAVIVVDGEVWDRPQGENRFSIDLAEGVHQVEVRKEGFQPYQRTVEVRRGRTFTLNVSLTPGGPSGPGGPGQGYTTARITRVSLLR